MTARTYRHWIALLALVTAECFSGQAAYSATIEQQIQRHIPQVIDYLNDHNIRNVGVLRFRVKKPGQKTSDSVGPLNSLLADRLEVGLILANPFQEERQLNIFKEASLQVAGIPGATHVNAAGRKLFFSQPYDLAWGRQSAMADAFLTGVVQVHDDNQHVTVGILCFDKQGGDLERVGEAFEADLDAAALGELGESFVLRGAFDHGSAKLTFEEDQTQKQHKAVKEAAEVKTQLTKFPYVDESAPVRLEITYDGQPVTVELRNGEAYLKEPREGQHVEMALVRNPTAQGRLGVVLKVNGQNTLFRQTQRDIDCNKWILSSDHTRTVVKGFQKENGKTAEQFRILSQDESARRAMDYGRYVGQIQLTVFQELTGPKPRPTLQNEDDEDLIAMLRGVHPPEQPRNLSALKGQLRRAGHDGSSLRGIIEGGSETASKIRTVTFVADPTPVMAMTITYYKP